MFPVPKGPSACPVPVAVQFHRLTGQMLHKKLPQMSVPNPLESAQGFVSDLNCTTLKQSMTC